MLVGDLLASEMRPAFTFLVALVVVAAAVPIGVAAAASADAPTAAAGAAPAQVTDDGTTTSSNTTENGTEDGSETASEDTATEEDAETNSSNETAPGAKLAGVVAVQQTEIDSEVDSRAFGQRVAAAATNESKAAVIATDVNESRERIETLRDRLAELERARESGEISEGRYRAQTAQLTAEINALERRLGQANESASSLPAPMREANGINASDIERLRTDARNLSGPETAAIAREIAGNNPGGGMGGPGDAPGRNGDVPGRSGGTDAANESDDRRPAEAGGGDVVRSNGSDRGVAGNDAPGRADGTAAGNDREGENATRNGDGSADAGPSEPARSASAFDFWLGLL